MSEEIIYERMAAIIRQLELLEKATGLIENQVQSLIRKVSILEGRLLDLKHPGQT